ncbi:uncharacterized protein JCM15063_006369 [Sporobolomyces koalae]|uniref:uncharacterized protein n=1 Tax=Sporobolomyces koalae TaxID=500713 RepID=UPI00317A7CC5
MLSVSESEMHPLVNQCVTWTILDLKSAYYVSDQQPPTCHVHALVEDLEAMNAKLLELEESDAIAIAARTVDYDVYERKRVGAPWYPESKKSALRRRAAPVSQGPTRSARGTTVTTYREPWDERLERQVGPRVNEFVTARHEYLRRNVQVSLARSILWGREAGVSTHLVHPFARR